MKSMNAAKTLFLMNYITPTLRLTGNYEHLINKNDDNANTCLFAFVATHIEVLNENLMPFNLRPYVNAPEKLVKEFNMWFQRRIMTFKRTTQIELLDKYIFSSDKKSLKHKSIDKVAFSSVTDKYWLHNHNTPVTKDDFQRKRLELYRKLTNSTDDFGNLCFTQNPYILKDINNIKLNNDTITILNNVNYCLGGITNKRWIYNKETDNVDLVKQRNAAYGQEPVNEILATKMLHYLKFPHLTFVEYEFYIDGMELCSRCKNFVGEKEEFIPMSDIIKVIKKDKDKSIYEHIIDCLKFLEIDNAENFIDEMIIFDRLSLNFDRHLCNFGVMRDVTNGCFLRMAPLFDMGSCFFAHYNNEIKVKNGKEQRTLLFLDRIKYLEKAGKIPVIDNTLLGTLKQELNNYIYTSADMDNKIIEKILEINQVAEQSLLLNQEELDKDSNSVSLEASL